MPNEKLGIRCSEISQRHRLYGPDVPACDLDFVLNEYDRAEPVALFEYKFWRGGPRIDLDQPSLKAFAVLATRADLPAFVVQYKVGDWMYRVFPANERAKEHMPRPRWLNEREYVTLLYRLRGKTAPPELLTTLKGDPFEDEDEWADLPEAPSLPSSRSSASVAEALMTILGEPWTEDEDDEGLGGATVEAACAA